MAPRPWMAWPRCSTRTTRQGHGYTRRGA